MLYQLSYASRKLPTLAKRKPNCKGFCDSQTSKLLEVVLSAPSLFFYAGSSLPSKPLWLDFLSGLSHATTDHGTPCQSRSQPG